MSIIAAAGLVLVGTVVATGNHAASEKEVLSAYISSEDMTPTPTNTPTPTSTPTPTNTPTPTPTVMPTPTRVPHTGTDIDKWLDRYAEEYGVDRGLLHKIGACESGFNSSSHNVRNDYGGIYQFSAGTWQSTRRAMGADTNPDLRFNPEEAIKTAAFKISRGGAGAWPACSR